MTITQEQIERLERDAALDFPHWCVVDTRDIAAILASYKAQREALEPFARCADELDGNEDVPRAPDGEWAKFRLLTDDYRRARTALGNQS